MESRSIKHIAVALVFLFSIACKNNHGNAVASDNPVFQSTSGLRRVTEQISKSPKDASLYYERGEMLHDMQLDSIAINDYKKAVSLDTTKAEYYSAVGNLLFDHKDITGSVSWIQKAIALNPEDRRARLKIAKVFLYIRQ